LVFIVGHTDPAKWHRNDEQECKGSQRRKLNIPIFSFDRQEHKMLLVGNWESIHVTHQMHC